MSAETKFTESEIIQAIQQGDHKAVRALYDHYASALYGIIYHIIPDKPVAEELLQETFVKAWRSFSSYDASKGKLYTWLLNIARNLAIDRTRSSDHKTAAHTQSINGQTTHINKTHQVAYEPEYLDIKELVDRLRPEQKELIDLIYFYGYTQAEAATRLKIPLGTVKTRVRAAVSELRKFFGVR